MNPNPMAEWPCLSAGYYSRANITIIKTKINNKNKYKYKKELHKKYQNIKIIE